MGHGQPITTVVVVAVVILYGGFKFIGILLGYFVQKLINRIALKFKQMNYCSLLVLNHSFRCVHIIVIFLEASTLLVCAFTLSLKTIE